jgi:hypothetical protein
MLPYTVIKEANPPQYGGTATGVVNFLNFTFSALLGPVFGWILRSVSGGAARMELEHYQAAFSSLLYGVGIAVVLTFLLRETGPAARSAGAAAKSGKENEHDPDTRDRKIRTTPGAVRKPRARSDGRGPSL